jgi:hypothetical protein
MKYLGDIAEDQITYFRFSTHKADGTPITLAGTPAISVYKNDDDTQSTAGVTLSVDDDSVTGMHTVKIDTSADAFYAVGADYSVVITTGTVDGVSVVGTVLATFSIENRTSFPRADYPSNFSELGIESDGDLTKVNALDGHTAQTGDAYAVVAHADYGNAKLVRSTTPANTLTVDAAHKVTVPDTQKVDAGPRVEGVGYLGSINRRQTIDFKFKTSGQLASGAISVYKNNETSTEVTTGVTLTANFDGVTGLNHVRIVTTNSFYAADCDYCVVITSGTIDGISVVGAIVATFSIDNRSPANKLLSGVIDFVTDQTHIFLAAGSTVDDIYNDQIIVIYDVSSSGNACARRIVDYDGNECSIVLDSAPSFTIVAGDLIKIFANSPYTAFDSSTAQSSAEAAIDAKFDFVGTRVKAIAQAMGKGVGDGDVFLFALTKTSAEPKVITEDGMSHEDFAEYDGTRRVTTHTEAAIGTQWKLDIEVLQSDVTGINPAVSFSSSDTSVATVDSGGFVSYVGNGSCKIIAQSAPTEDSPAFTQEVTITNSTSTPATTGVATYIPAAFNSADHMLVLYNSTVAESIQLKDYYLANRPGVSGANTLGLNLPNSHEITADNASTYIYDPVKQWFLDNPTKHIRYIVLMYGLPTKQNPSPFAFNVAYQLQSLLRVKGIRSGDSYPALYQGVIAPYSVCRFPGSTLVCAIDMGSYAASAAYIDKLAAMATVEGALESDGATISASAGGYAADMWILDDTRKDNYTAYPQMPAIRDRLLAAGIAEGKINYQDGTRVSTAANVTAWRSWGVHTPLTNGWPINDVTLSGSSGWYLLTTIESYNGQYASSHGDPTEFFAANAFGGTDYSNTPVFFYGHTQEPYLGGIATAAYEELWARGYLAIECAWKAAMNSPILPLGDPLVRR